MDAKVLRAAVSAAIRVTVSTTLIGCGGNVGRETDGPRKTTDGAAGTAGSYEAVGSGGGHQVAPAPITTDTNGGNPSATGGAATAATAGATTAGTGAAVAGIGAAAGTAPELETGGVPNAGGTGQGGEPGSAGAPPEICGGAVDACLSQIALELPTEALSEAANACCQTVIVGFDELRMASAPCLSELERTFRVSGVRGMCCADQATWEHTACTPWGPPVPPELPAAMLRAWSLVA